MDSKPFIKLVKSPFNKYIYDVNTNQVIKISEELYNYLNNQSDETPSESVKDQINFLKKKGYLSDNRAKKIIHSESNRLSYHLEKNITQITLQVTQQCNFRCSYCPYTTAEFDNNREHGSKIMSMETAKKAIDFFAEHSIEQDSVCIGFYGGEPLLSFNLIKEAVDYAEKIFLGKEISFTLTTNGSLLTDDVLNFISKHNFHFMISLDGPPETHNRSRKFAASGKGTFSFIEKNLKNIIENYPDLIPMISINVVIDPRYSANNFHRMFSNDCVFSKFQIQSTLIDDFFSIEKVTLGNEYSIEDGIHMFKAYAAYINRYPKDKVSKVAYNRIMTSFERNKMFMKPEKMLPPECAPGGPCVPGQRRLFIDVDGNFFPCERVSETSEAMKIGNIDRGFDYDQAYRLLNIGQLTSERCKNCFAFRHCSICAKLCDNNGELSAELKLSNCRNVKRDTMRTLEDYIFEKELHEEKKSE